MVASIGPFWDANETVARCSASASCLARSRFAHGVVLTRSTFPSVAMLIGSCCAAVAFELRIKAHGWHRELWNWLFWAGSFVASFFQGVMLGRYITGFERGIGYWLFALTWARACAAATCSSARPGSSSRPRASCGASRWLGALGLAWVGLGFALVSAATPLVSATVRDKWFDFPRTLGLMLLPAATLAAAAWLWKVTGRMKAGATGGDWHPFAAATAIFTLAFAGLAYSIYPYVVIDRLTIWEAAAHPSALKVLLLGSAVVLPFIVGYTVIAYRIFGGKARAGLYD
jgi:cytochrome d ubiquinol oxidase subunit II